MRVAKVTLCGLSHLFAFKGTRLSDIEWVLWKTRKLKRLCVCELQNIKNLHKILQYGVNVYDKLGRGCNIFQNAEYNEHWTSILCKGKSCNAAVLFLNLNPRFNLFPAAFVNAERLWAKLGSEWCYRFISVALWTTVFTGIDLFLMSDCGLHTFGTIYFHIQLMY